MDDRHILYRVIASDCKSLKLPVNKHAAHTDIEGRTVFKNVMYTPDFIIQMLLHIVTLL